MKRKKNVECRERGFDSVRDEFPTLKERRGEEIKNVSATREKIQMKDTEAVQ